MTYTYHPFTMQATIIMIMMSREQATVAPTIAGVLLLLDPLECGIPGGVVGIK